MASLAAASGAAASGDTGILIPPTEAADIATVVGTVEKFVNLAAASGEKPVLRDAHAKGHGCVQARFDVRKKLPRALRHGVFAVPRSFPAWVRFSNGNGAPQDDHANDGRGMAIKLLGVPGRKLLPAEARATTQDFVMINFPVFFIRNVADYVPFTAASLKGQTAAFFATHPHEGAISQAIGSQTVDYAFEQSYFSMSPYRLGPRFIKFRTRPVVCATRVPIVESTAPEPVGNANYLRQGMIDWLKDRDACFEFGVQLRADPATMPIEDPTIEWNESVSPYVTVADITIPRQTFASTAQQTYCENLSFSPWHALPAHEPVGGINRMRRAVYLAISKMRHQLNRAVRAEPTRMQSFN